MADEERDDDGRSRRLHTNALGDDIRSLEVDEEPHDDGSPRRQHTNALGDDNSSLEVDTGATPFMRAPRHDSARERQLLPGLPPRMRVPLRQGSEDEKGFECAICLDVVERHLVVELRCGHKFCANCLHQCAARGMTTCLSCREPHELSPVALRARYHDFRTGYRNWRAGAAKGARGDPSDLFLKRSSPAPVTIWLFWDSETVPSVIQACVASWKRWNQRVILLTPKTVGNYLRDWSDLSFESSRAKVTWIGLSLIEERGGIWVDASTWCTAPVETWLSTDRSKVALFASRHHSHIYEPWMVASPRAKHPLVVAWRKELSVANVVGAQSYIDTACKTCDGLRCCETPRRIDLCCHFALLVALYDEPQLESDVVAHSAATGPRSRAQRFHGDSELVVKDLATKPLNTMTDSIMIKFDQREVEAVQSRLDACHFEAGSALHVLFDYLSDTKDESCPSKEAES